MGLGLEGDVHLSQPLLAHRGTEVVAVAVGEVASCHRSKKIRQYERQVPADEAGVDRESRKDAMQLASQTNRKKRGLHPVPVKASETNLPRRLRLRQPSQLRGCQWRMTSRRTLVGCSPILLS
jgi:hypothetical protein